MQLEQRHWYLPNWQHLNKFLTTLKTHNAPPVAVFDWDNTSIFNDISIVAFRYLLDTLQLKISPQELQAILPDVVSGKTHVHSGEKISDLNKELLEAYAALWPSMSSEKQHQVLQTPAHLVFKTRLMWLYDAFEDTPGIGATHAYPWLATLLAGFVEHELQDLTAKSFDAYAHETICKQTWQANDKLQWSYVTGIAIKPEILELMHCLKHYGVELFVVTASQQDLVKGLAKRLGYPILPENILGLHLDKNPQGLFQPVCANIAENLVPYREGKSAVIRAKIKREPILVAGDTSSDFFMLTDFASTQIRLVIHRHLSGEIQKLYDIKTAPKGTLVQGRLEREGRFHNESTSVLL